MTELVLGAVLIAIALYFIVRFAKDENGFVRRTSRGAFMRDLNKSMEKSERSRNL
jgi:hypothetical protein